MNGYHYYALVTILFWSLAYILTRLALQDFSPFALGFLRYFIASIVLSGLIIKAHPGLPRLQDTPLFLSSGATGFFLYMIVFNLGQAKVSAAAASLIIATVPVFTALIAHFRFAEKLGFFQWIAVAIEFFGVAIMTGLEISLEADGIILLLLAAVLLSLYNITQRKLVRIYTPTVASIYSIFCGAAMLAIFLPEAVNEVFNATVSSLTYLLVLGIGSSAIAYFAWTKAFAMAPKTAQVSNYMFLTPFLAAFFGYALGGEVPDAATVTGGIVIIAGMLLFNFARIENLKEISGKSK